MKPTGDSDLEGAGLKRSRLHRRRNCCLTKARFLAMVYLVVLVPVITAEGQHHATDKMACGPNSVAVAARLLDRELTDADLELAFDGSLQGPHSFSEMESGARAAGLAVRVARVDIGQGTIDNLPLIVMLHDRTRPGSEEDETAHGHFVVLYGRVGGQIQVLDYPHGPVFIAPEALAKKCDGWALYVGRSWKDFIFTVDMPRWLAIAVGFAGIAVAVTCIYLAKTSRNTREGETAAEFNRGLERNDD